MCPASRGIMTRRPFMVDQADALIPLLEGVLGDVRGELDRLRLRAEKLQVLDVLWGKRVEQPGNPDHEELVEHRRAVLQGEARIAALIQDEILARGIRFPQGGLEQGLLDFPTTYRGRWVYLCWQSGEPRVVAWHELDTGYRGRRPLTEEQARVMGRESEGLLPDDSMLDF